MKLDKVIEKIIMKQFEIIDVKISYHELKLMQNWFQEYTMNQNQYNEWKKFSIETLRKECKMPKYKAEKNFDFINLNWGLKNE